MKNLKSDSDEMYLISRILNPVNVTDAKKLCIFHTSKAVQCWLNLS